MIFCDANVLLAVEDSDHADHTDVLCLLRSSAGLETLELSLSVYGAA